MFPGVLLALSHLMPAQFPFHPNWKTTECHFAYWDLWPTIDHILPVSRNGCNDESNWASTSMLRNSAKANWTLEELGWQLLPPGNLADWDGLIHDFLRLAAQEPDVIAGRERREWHRVAVQVLEEHRQGGE